VLKLLLCKVELTAISKNEFYFRLFQR